MVISECQGTGGDALAGFAVEEHDLIAGHGEGNLRTDGKERASEDDAGQQEASDADLDRRLHAGRHSAVNFAAELALVCDVDEFGADAEDEILVCNFGELRKESSSSLTFAM